jgi:type II secretory pathway pseudopilin PulG
MEMMLALAVFVGAALAILSAIGQSAASLAAAKERQRAADLARSALSRIEAGIDTAETLSGPVPEWQDEESDPEFDDSPPAPTGWELTIRTTPFGGVGRGGEAATGGGLTLVEITALRRDPGRAAPAVTFTLRQLVRLGAEGEDRVGDLDDIGRAAERARRGARGTGGGSP